MNFKQAHISNNHVRICSKICDLIFTLYNTTTDRMKETFETFLCFKLR